MGRLFTGEVLPVQRKDAAGQGAEALGHVRPVFLILSFEALTLEPDPLSSSHRSALS